MAGGSVGESGFGGILGAAVAGMAVVLLVCAVGAGLAVLPRASPLLHPRLLKELSRLMVNLAWTSMAIRCAQHSARSRFPDTPTSRH